MPVQIMNLRGVPEDEAEAIRELLEHHAVDYYETPPGNWGISIPALWVHDETQAQRAKSLIEKYQYEHFARARSEYEQRKSAGQQHTLLTVIRQNPVRFAVYLAVIVLVLYLSIHPFLSFH